MSLSEINLLWRELAANCGFTEGPVARAGEVYFTSINRGAVYRVPMAGGVAVQFAEAGGGPNGMAMDTKGNLWVAQNGGKVIPTKSTIRCAPSIQIITPQGQISTPSSSGFAAPNDCAFGPDGRLWFTDPAGSTEDAQPAPGRLWAMDIGSGNCEMILEGLAHPNGLAFGQDGDTLYVGETRRKQIIRLNQSAQGWRHAGVYAEMPVGEPDGMAFDTAGNLWVAATKADAIVVIRAGGKSFRIAPLGGPTFPTNVCFGGADMRSLVVTAPKGGRVLCSEVEVPGLPLL